MEVLKKWLIGTLFGFDSIALLEKSFEAFMVVEERGEKTEETESKRENGVEKDQNLEGKSYLGGKKKRWIKEDFR